MYDGIFRKGFLEPYTTHLAHRRSNVPKRKFHNNHATEWNGDEPKETGVAFIE